MIIYKSTNKINGKSYIGQTIGSLSNRKREHIRDALNNRYGYYFHNAIRKYGAGNFYWDIVDECDDIDELNRLEIYYIRYFDTFNNGYNLTKGGEGMCGWKPTKEIKKKIAESLKGRSWGSHTEESKKKMSELQKGVDNSFYNKNHTEKTRQKMSEAHKGIKLVSFSEEHKQKISESKKGQIPWNKGKTGVYSEKTLQKMSKSQKGKKHPEHSESMSAKNNPNAKSIVLIYPNSLEEKFDCIADACRKYNLSQSNLTLVIQGKRKQHKGYKCRYAT